MFSSCWIVDGVACMVVPITVFSVELTAGFFIIDMTLSAMMQCLLRLSPDLSCQDSCFSRPLSSTSSPLCIDLLQYSACGPNVVTSIKQTSFSCSPCLFFVTRLDATLNRTLSIHLKHWILQHCYEDFEHDFEKKLRCIQRLAEVWFWAAFL